jgi:hypothetical protein
MTRVTDAALQLRKPISELSSEQRETIVRDKLLLAQNWFRGKGKTLIDWSQPPLEASEFRELLKQLTDATRDYFRTQFLQGTSGEDVPFWKIKSAQDTLDQLCFASFALFSYCNDYKSWWTCTQAKINALAQGGKERAVKGYMAQAKGPYVEKCEKDLKILLEAGKLDRDILLSSQIGLDEEILLAQLLEAEKQAKIRVESIFDCRSLDQPRSRLSCGSASEVCFSL